MEPFLSLQWVLNSLPTEIAMDYCEVNGISYKDAMKRNEMETRSLDFDADDGWDLR